MYTKLYIYKNSIFAVLLSILLSSCKTSTKKENFSEKEETERDGAKEMLQRDIKMMKDPALGYVPTERLIEAKRYRDNLLQSSSNAAISGISWRTLGPKNQGGRSRSVLVDANDATGNIVWVGSVGGGLWKTTNITAASPNWTPVNDFFDNLSVSSIAQDPSNAQIMYFTTGEGYFNGDALRGLGVWKTTNGGTTWAQIASTNTTNFYYCQRVVVNSTGVVFVATRNAGLQRSTDGGTSWTKVLGTGLGITGAGNNFCYDVDIAGNGDIFATLSASVHKSTNAGVTFNAAQTLPIAADRIELACAPNDANYVYALVESGNVVNGILRTVDGGTNWISRTEPADADPGIPATDFSRSQAWYDLTIAVDPNNKDVVFVGGVDLFKSFDGCNSWSQIAHWYGGFGFQNVHADQHYILFKPGSSSIAYFVNDGGIYRTANANSAVPTILDKGNNYVTAQFYACAIHPAALTDHYLAGAQDNGSHKFTQGVLQNTIEVTGGDGAYCHIDQNQPQYQFTSYVYNNFYRSTDGGNTFNSVTTSGGSFISPTDYDDANDLMYMNNTAGTYKRWDDPQTGGTFAAVTVAAFGGGNVSAIKVSPNTNHKVFFGIDNGRVVRVDNANTATPTATNISTGLPASYLNCVEVETGNDNHLLAVYSNFGVNSIWESLNGGTTWTSVEGNLPDMPIRWAIFNPNNNDQAIIATELGVWSTDNLNGVSTVWGTSNSGLANVSVDMLQIRTSDKVMIAATHGRGLFVSSSLSPATALFTADRLTTYQGVPINFTSTSYGASSWSWNFGDATSSTIENPAHAYATAGKYNVTLTINAGASTITKNLYIHVLPNKGTPYAPAAGGNFETNVNDFGIDITSGTAWERGNSAVVGKSGTTSGTNAWVTGLTGNYVDNTDASLMTPNYNFTAIGAYMMKFQSKRNAETNYDGFRVEYTLDSGRSWSPLGTTTGAGWYNFANTVGDAAFPVNEAFFSGAATTYTLYSYDMTFLQGNKSVAFRVRFKSDGSVNAAGAAIDDFEIVGPINIALAVNLINFEGKKTINNVKLNWKTSNENNVKNYTVERSFDANSFTAIENVTAQNLLSNTYTFVDVNALTNFSNRQYLYYRLKINDKVGNFKYSNTIRIDVLNNNNEAIVGPNPFTNYINVINAGKILSMSLIDLNGRVIYYNEDINGSTIYINRALQKGYYVAKIVTEKGIIVKQLYKTN